MGEVIFITSGKGGVGKTTVTANLGKELARSDKKVMLIDFDFGLRNLDIMLGLEQAVVYDISDVLEGRCRLRQAMIHPWRDLPLYFLPAASQADYLPESERFSYLMENLSASFDYILIDSPAGVSPVFDITSPFLTSVIVVVTSDSASISDASYIFRTLPGKRRTARYLILNRFPHGKRQRRRKLDAEDLHLFFHVPVLGTVYEDRKAEECADYGQLISEKSRVAGRSFAEISRQILDYSSINKG